MVPLGRYQHYKGSVYEVIGIAIHSETKEQLVVYKEELGAILWARPLNMFTENIVHEGKEVQRFRFLG